ncbi:alpha/beta fold hydrolase [Mucilaginibacter terrae]|uniref:Pimeloyl-ACP methyl ester carboxylesterase n=1 Tax=Mucilaginibacter terrae TaxID=1955052 RepID=A0ABU3GZW8_9SPHI|nr:alpha/beta hydrolase [Mucilaginibacter terrae]MDT3405315.1 pimeloyl-ACP methyl ester carboxylesterase [Mucilaginibacter terrae]
MDNILKDQVPAGQKNFVLVHGAWQAPYAWNTVKELLLAEGFNVSVIQLPGHGADNTPHNLLHMETYINHVAGEIKKIGLPVILVGHSMAGIIISGVAEILPQTVDKLVYLAAYLPKDGDSAYSISLNDKQSLLGASLIVSEDQVEFDINKEDVTHIFCQDATDEVKQLVMENYRPEPGAPFGEPVALSHESFGSVPKYYIETELDNGIGSILQKQMIAAAAVKNSYAINSGHLPALSKPKEVSEILKQIAFQNN